MKYRSPMVIIFITAFINMLGVGIILPLLPYYVKIIEQSSNPLLADNRALIVGALVASYSLCQFLFAPVLGALSDRFGRRPVLLISIGGTALSYMLLGLAHRFVGFGVEAVIGVLFIARIFDGITGGNISTLHAYIADSTKPQERAKGMGMIGAAFGLGFMLGPAIGGLLSTISLSTPAFVAAAVSLACFIVGFFMLPESLPVEQRTTIPLAKMNPANQLRGVISKHNIRPLLFGVFLFSFAFAGLQSNFAVFTDVRFGFSPMDNALVFAFLGVIMVFMQGFLIRKLVPLFGEARLAIVGLVMMMLSFGMIPMVTVAWMLYPVLAILAVGSGIAIPAITGLLSQRASAHEQGSVLGGNQAVMSLTMVLGPLYAGFAFDTVGIAAPYLSGLVFITAAVVVMGAALWSYIVPHRVPVILDRR